MIVSYFEEVKNTGTGRVVNPVVQMDEEEIRKKAIEEIERITGFHRKEMFRRNDIKYTFEDELKEYGLKARDGYDIFKAFIQENKERPITNVEATLNLLIDEKVNGANVGICHECGEKLLKHAIYCVYCGEKVLSRYRLK